MFYKGCDQQGYNADCDDDNEYSTGLKDGMEFYANIILLVIKFCEVLF
jgi:hypothetical protein